MFLLDLPRLMQLLFAAMGSWLLDRRTDGLGRLFEAAGLDFVGERNDGLVRKTHARGLQFTDEKNMVLNGGDGRAFVHRHLDLKRTAGTTAADAPRQRRDMSVVQQTAGSLTFLGAFFIVALTPLFTWLWPWLDKRGLNPSKPAKSAIGLLFGGLAFLPMVYAAHLAGISGIASVWWLVLAYAVLELGELCISPIGLSAVTQLSVPRVVSVMMGAWFLATAYSEVLAARFGELTAMDVTAGETLNVAVAAARYGDLFMMMFWIGIAASAVAFALIPLVRRGMHGVK